MLSLSRKDAKSASIKTHQLREHIMEFYNVKKRASVKVADKDCTKVEFKKETSKGVQVRYGVKAVDTDGTKLTKFVSKATYDKLKCPVAK